MRLLKFAVLYKFGLKHEVGADALYLSDDHILRRLPDGHQHDHRRDADDNAEHRQNGTHLAVCEAAGGSFKRVGE